MTVKFLLSYTTQPIQIFGLWGLVSLIGGIGIGIYLSIAKFLYQIDLADRPLLLLAVLLVMIGIQLISLGEVPIIIHKAGVYFRNLFGKDDFWYSTGAQAQQNEEQLSKNAVLF